MSASVEVALPTASWEIAEKAHLPLESPETVIFHEKYRTRELQKAEMMRSGRVGRHNINTIAGMPPRFVDVVGYEPFGLTENEEGVSGYFIQYVVGEHPHLGNRNKRPLSGWPETVMIKKVSCTEEGLQFSILRGENYHRKFTQFLKERYDTTHFVP